MARGKYTKAEILEMIDRPDITHVEGKDPNRYYRHAEDDELRILQLKREGFRVETEEDGAEPDSPTAVKSDGTSKVVNIPKHVLMSRPKDLHDEIMEAKRTRFEHMAKREEEENLEDAKRIMKKIGMPTKITRRLENTKTSF